MLVRILGAHQAESRDHRFISILIDDHLVIDAGGLTSTLTLEEQRRLEAVLITHRHFDHIKDLPPLVHNLWESKSVHVYCIEDVRGMLVEHVFNDLLWPAVHAVSGDRRPLVFHVVEPGDPFDVLGYRVLALSMPHTVPVVGYYVERGGKRLFYTSDTRATGDPAWANLPLDLLLVETTMCSRDEQRAEQVGHMTPLSLERELHAYHARQGYYPRTVCVHINPGHEDRIREEIGDLAAKLRADIRLAHEGMVIEL
jgi:phosphoribosyl 1,2-cyclic phosphodiesterase